MNWIDIIILLIFCYAIYSGASKGLVVQLCSTFAIFLSIWLGVKCGASVGEAIGVSSNLAFVVGLSIVVLVTTIIVAIIARILRKVFSLVGLGMVDRALGAVISVCKYALILSVLLGALGTTGTSMSMIDPQTLEESKLYQPLINISDSIFPAIDWTKQQIDSGLERFQ